MIKQPIVVLKKKAFYRLYRKQYRLKKGEPNKLVTELEYGQIVDRFNELLFVKTLLEGKAKLPEGTGELRIVRTSLQNIALGSRRVDYISSKKYNTTIRFSNDHTGGDYFSFQLRPSLSLYPIRNVYKFELDQKLRHIMSEYLKGYPNHTELPYSIEK